MFFCLLVCLFVFVFNIRWCKMPDAVVCHCTITNAQVNLYVALAFQCYSVDTYSFGNNNHFLVLIIATYRSLVIVVISTSVRHLLHAATCLTGSQQSHVIMLPRYDSCPLSLPMLSQSTKSWCLFQPITLVLVDTILFYFKINPPTPYISVCHEAMYCTLPCWASTTRFRALIITKWREFIRWFLTTLFPLFRGLTQCIMSGGHSKPPPSLQTWDSVESPLCIRHNLAYVNPSGDTLGVYTEYLAQRMKSAKSVKNYLSAVSLYHNLLGLLANNLDNFQYQTMRRALSLTMRHSPIQRLAIRPSLLAQICHVCDHLSTPGLVFKVAFLLAFYGFLRQSNLAPHCRTGLDSSRHTMRCDILIQAPVLVVLLKWTKIHQATQTPTAIPIPTIPGHALDPVAAYQAMIARVPTRHPSDPLLALPRGRVLITRQLQTGLQAILSGLGYNARLYSLHSLRRGGATASARAGVNYLHIMRHGTWRSTAFWSYIANHIITDSPIASALKHATERMS